MAISGPGPGTDPSIRRHHALGTASRAGLLDVLGRTPGGVDAKRAAAAVGLHHTTARWHLELLVHEGLARRRTEERSAPGRPRVLYEAIADEQVAQPSGYQLLARILSSYVATAQDPAATGKELGETWGRFLTDRPSPLERISADDALGRLLAQFATLGFQPELTSDGTGDHMLLHRCPFREVAAERPDLVCSIHLGLMRGALAELGAPVTVTKLLPFVEPSLCVSHLQRTA
ncbi:MAG TPA: ArsR family transcriptional regulator [Actinomycetota bacterium]|nr:ArsR family transcriptional regulator [Actinomycetota bacterium]